MRQTGERWRLGHVPGLDGLRGIAILLVLFAHAVPHHARAAGGVGVAVFFGLSGFLITSLLLEHCARTGRVSLRRFYERRVRRLAPALIVYLAFWVTMSALGVGPFRILPGEVVVAVFYLTNWLMIAGGASQPISITWSLSVEEQFYLLWPLTFLLARKWPNMPIYTAAVGVVYAVGMRAVMWHDGALAWSIYYRSESHMDSLFVGCLLAVAVSRGFRANSTPASVAAVAATAAIGAMVVTRHAALNVVLEPLLVPLATCVVIAALLGGRARWLEQPVLRWFGRRSYALYLWHYPLAAMAWEGIVPMWIAILAALLVAEVSWWCVERHFLRKRADLGAERSLQGSGPSAPASVSAVVHSPNPRTVMSHPETPLIVTVDGGERCAT